MNNTDRLIRALTLQPVDRPPVTSVLTGVTESLMEKTGISWPDAHTDPSAMADLAAASWKYFGVESMKIPFCMTIEAEALGSGVNLGGKTTLPQISKHVYDEYGDVTMPENFLSRGRIPTVLKAISIAKERYGKEIPVISSIVGPFTIAGKLFEFQDILMDLLMEPEDVKTLLETLTDVCICYANAQAKAGCDAILIGEASCSGDVISPKMYEEFVVPCHKKLAENVSVPMILHICGNCTGHLPYIAETGLDAFSFDYRTDIQEVHRYLDGKMASVGYVDPLDVLMSGTPERIRSKVEECLRNKVDVLNAGCSWPANVPDENIEAFVQAAHAVFEK